MKIFFNKNKKKRKIDIVIVLFFFVVTVLIGYGGGFSSEGQVTKNVNLPGFVSTICCMYTPNFNSVAGGEVSINSPMALVKVQGINGPSMVNKKCRDILAMEQQKGNLIDYNFKVFSLNKCDVSGDRVKDLTEVCDDRDFGNSKYYCLKGEVPYCTQDCKKIWCEKEKTFFKRIFQNWQVYAK